MPGQSTAVYAGSFDPPTEGHMYMIRKGAAIFGKLIVAVGDNPNKASFFDADERIAMLHECVEGLANVAVERFAARFLVDYTGSVGAAYILRGIRSARDYEFERAMRNVNDDIGPDITTLFLMPPRELCEISSSFVRSLIGPQGWQDVIRPYVPEPVYRRLLARST